MNPAEVQRVNILGVGVNAIDMSIAINTRFVTGLERNGRSQLCSRVTGAWLG